MRVLIFLCVVAGTALVYLMSEAPSNTALFTQNLQLLLYLAGAMALGLMALIVYQLLTLRRKLRERVFTEQHRERIRIAKLGKSLSSEHRASISHALRGTRTRD